MCGAATEIVKRLKRAPYSRKVRDGVGDDVVVVSMQRRHQEGMQVNILVNKNGS